jgi:Arc/MetJ-type ribon-helix-helix transcriptional regulator
MAKTVVIAVRVPEKIKREIEELGLEIPDFVREAIEEKLKRRKSNDALEWITANRVKGKEIGFNSASILRQMRETM